MVALRTRLTLWNTGVFAALIALYVIVVMALLREGLLQDLDEQLAGDAERLEQTFAWDAAGGELHPRAPLGIGEGGEEAAWVEIESASGQALFRSPSLGARRLPLAPQTRGRGRSFATVRLAGGIEARMLSFVEPVGGREVVFGIARETRPYQRRLGTIQRLFVLASPAAVLLALLGGWFLARKALAPVDRMRESAERMSAEKLGERLPTPARNDELGRLAVTLNGLLERLHGSFETLRRFTADASHELRTPLAAMRAEIEVCLRSARAPGQYRETLESTLEELGRLTLLVDALLTLSRADAGRIDVHLEALPLEAVAAAVCEELRILAEEKNQRFQCQLATAEVLADEELLRRALANVVHNAIRYTPPGGSIRVALRAAGDAVSLAVEDDGPGVAPEHRERIFDRFYRIDKSRSRSLGGVGLGLAIARWALERMGGGIELEESSSGGARFVLRLRRAGAGGR